MDRMAHAIETVKWAVEIFGPDATRRDERTLRFLEEAIELGHALAVPLPQILKLVARVYERPRGSSFREFSQTAMCFDALCAVAGIDPDASARLEFDRVKALPAADRLASHRAKVDAGIAYGGES